MSRRIRIAVLAALACVVFVELVARGPYRALTGHCTDLTVHYAAARVWLAGGNPWDMTAVGEAYLAGGGNPEILPRATDMPSVYPASTIALEAPLAFLHWTQAVVLMEIISGVLVALALAALARETHLDGVRAVTFVVGALALAPLHTGLASGQVAVPVAALLILSWTLGATRPALAGALLAFAVTLKPHFALPFVVLGLLRPRLRWVIAAGAVSLALFGVGALRLWAAGHAPIDDWLRAVSAAAAPGGMNSPLPEAISAPSLISLDMLLLRFFDSEAAARALQLALVVPLAALAAWRLRVEDQAYDQLYALSLLCVVSLLAMYHRTYDAVLLWLPLVAYVRDWHRLPRAQRVVAGVVFAGFALPGPAMFDRAARLGLVTHEQTSSLLWRYVAIPHQVWLLCAFAVALAGLVLAASRESGTAVARRDLARPQPRTS